MRIKDFTDTIRHLTDSFNIPEARRMIQENPALTQEQFVEDSKELQRVAEGAFAPERIEMPNWRDLIREEGIQVGEQVAEGRRIGLQSGQLVQHGPGRPGYGGKIIQTPELQKLLEKYGIKGDVKNAGRLANAYGIEKADELIKTDRHSRTIAGKTYTYPRKRKVTHGIYIKFVHAPLFFLSI